MMMKVNEFNGFNDLCQTASANYYYYYYYY